MARWNGWLAAAAAGLAMTLAPLAARAEDTLAKVKDKGVLVVGVKNDYRPWGFLDPSGKIVGLEPDLAKEVADKIGVKLEMIPVTAANRMEFLRQGRIDLMIATFGDTPERRKLVGMVEPNYYAGASNVFAPKSAGLKDWPDLKGKKVCGVQGAYDNRRIVQTYGPDLVVFPSVPDAFNALAGGNCVAFLFDDTLFSSTLAANDPKWAGYEIPFTSQNPLLWAVAVRQEDLDGPFGKLLKDMSVAWHKSGHLLDLEKKWGIKQSPYLLETHEKLKNAS